MNDKQKEIRFLMTQLSIPELAELTETTIKDIELRLLREMKTCGVSVKAFSDKVGRFESHIYSWKNAGKPAAISKIIEMGKRYK